MNTLLIISVSFPFGSAGSSIIKSIARALSVDGNKVFILSLVPSGEVTQKRGRYEELQGFCYTNVPGIWIPQSLKNQRTVKNLWNIFSSILSSEKMAKEIINKEKIDNIVFYTWSYIEINSIYKFARSLGLGVSAYVVEYPSRNYFRFGLLNPLFWNTKKLLSDTYAHLDGVICITSRIEAIFRQKGLRTLRIPALVDPEFYQGVAARNEQKPSDCSLITYVGSLAFKDDPLLLLEVMRILADKGVNFQFRVIGPIIKSDLSDKFIFETQKDASLNSRISLLGAFSQAELKPFMLSSDILLLPRSNQPGVMAAFPTRLPELLLTGKPVVSTDVGDLQEYIQDGVTARLAVPGNAADMAEKIISLICDPELSARIGNAGKQCALSSFNYLTYSRSLNAFLGGRK